MSERELTIRVLDSEGRIFLDEGQPMLKVDEEFVYHGRFTDALTELVRKVERNSSLKGGYSVVLEFKKSPQSLIETINGEYDEPK